MKKWFLRVYQKVNIFKCFTLVLAVLCLVLADSERVEAAEEDFEGFAYVGTFDYNGKEIAYYYINDIYISYTDVVIYADFVDGPMYGFRYEIDGRNRFIMISARSNRWIWRDSSDSRLIYDFATEYIQNEDYYKLVIHPDALDLNATIPSSGELDIGVENAFFSYFVSDSFIKYKKPVVLDFNTALDASWVWIDDFRASLEEQTIYMTWGEFTSTLLAEIENLKTYEHRYIGLAAYFRDERYEEDKSYDDYFISDVVFTEYTAFEGSITFEDFEAPEGYRLLYLYAYPFWFWDDNPDNNLQKGKMSMVTFDETGGSNNAIVKNPNDIYNPIDPDFSNWNAITNFTGNYFQNMQQTFDNTFQSYDSTGMNDNNDKLGAGLRRYTDAQDSIINGVSENIAQFNPGEYLNFSESIMVAMGLTSGWINQFLDVSSDFTTVFIVGCLMVVVFVVIGIWRFQG